MFRSTDSAISSCASISNFERLLKSVIDKFPAVVAYFDRDLKCLWANEKTQRWFGRSQGEIVGQGIQEILPEGCASRRRREMARALAGESVVFEEKLRHPTRGERFARVTIAPDKDEEGEVRALTVLVQDITEQKAIADLMGVERHKLRMIFKTSPASMALLRGEDLVFDMANPTCQSFLPGRQLIGRALLEVAPELTHQAFPSQLLEVLRSGRDFVAKESLCRIARPSDGKLEDHYFDFVYSQIKDPEGKPYGVFINALDVTERVTAQRRLRESEDRLNLALHAAQIGFWDVNAKTGYVLLSDTLMADWGIDPENFSHRLRECFECMHPDDQERVQLEIDRSLEQKTAYDIEFRVLRPSGEEIWVNAKGRFYQDAEGVPERLTGVTFNITEQKRISDLLRKAKDEADAANKAKSTFLANMSHEIRTPLGAMLGFAELIGQPDTRPNERGGYIDILKRNGQQLAVLINDILDLSKVEAGQLTVESIPVRPEDILEDVISSVQIGARERGILLESICEPSTPREVGSDPVRIRQILMNLVGNSIKFTERGSVRVRSFGRRDRAGHACVVFEVTDTGIGLHESQREEIFEPFVQADGSITRKFGGTGLGLALSRKLARSLGGDVLVTRSKVGVGSTFEFSFADRRNRRPLAPASAPARRALPAERGQDVGVALNGVRVLIVDDSKDNRQLFGLLLSRSGLEVETANNGVEGYSRAMRENFDLVLMDVQMPEMDGYTATKKLRQSGFQKPIVALTAHAMSEVRQKCLEAGYSDYISKPVVPVNLISTVQRALSGRSERTLH